MLWGNDAKKYEDIVTGYGHFALTWTHPSPLADNRLNHECKFINCNHFDFVNKELNKKQLSPICWDNKSKYTAFVDGACTDNGGSNPQASFACIIISRLIDSHIIVRGRVHPRKYYLSDDGKILTKDTNTDLIAKQPIGQPLMPYILDSHHRSLFIKPSNNRGELLAIIYCLKTLILLQVLGDVEIISDSYTSVTMLDVWFKNRLDKGSERDIKNLDLVKIGYALLCELKKICKSVKLIHIRGHQKITTDMTLEQSMFISGNNKADLLATNLLKNNNISNMEIIGPDILYFKL
jgi:ribonuclease HI